jgi:hypothetical protein
MDFDQAIQAHVEWKAKLRGYLAKADKSLKSSEVAKDDQCALGKWIYTEGVKYSHLPEFIMLKAEHLKFHQYTAQIVDLVNTGKVQQAETLLQAGSDFMKLSGNCVSLIMQVKQKALKK